MNGKPEILIEMLTPEETRMVTETAGPGKELCMRGILMQSSIKNRNGRYYTLEEMSQQVEAAKKTIKTNDGIWGELDHPQSLNINLDRVSHVITEMYMEGPNCMGKIEIVPTVPMGQILKGLVEFRKGRVGVSSRAAGNVNESGMVSGFSFVTVDAVANPSADKARPESIYEGLENFNGGQKIKSLAEAACEDPKAQKYLKEAILKWVESTVLFGK